MYNPIEVDGVFYGEEEIREMRRDLGLAGELRSAAVEYFNSTIAETVRHEVRIVSTNKESFERIEAASKRLQDILDRTSKSKGDAE